MALVVKYNPFFGASSMELDVTAEQLRAWSEGGYVQEVFPHLTDGEREFLVSGITPAQWEELFGD